jgi:hypothetical protein
MKTNEVFLSKITLLQVVRTNDLLLLLDKKSREMASIKIVAHYDDSEVANAFVKAVKEYEALLGIARVAGDAIAVGQVVGNSRDNLVKALSAYSAIRKAGK